MRYVTVTDVGRRFAVLLDEAQREPVAIRRRSRAVAVTLSIEEYDRLRALDVTEFDHFCDRVAGKSAARGLTARKLQWLSS